MRRFDVVTKLSVTLPGYHLANGDPEGLREYMAQVAIQIVPRGTNHYFEQMTPQNKAPTL